jgi:tetratricopeptide (TPR) repeat protein
MEMARALLGGYDGAGDLWEANEYVNRALRLRPNEPEAWILKSQILSSLDDDPAAMAAAEMAVRRAPRSAEAHYVRAAVLADLERYPDALKAVERAFRHMGTDDDWLLEDLYYEKAAILDALDRADEAMATFETGLKRCPESSLLKAGPSSRCGASACAAPSKSFPAGVVRPLPAPFPPRSLLQQESTRLFREHESKHMTKQAPVAALGRCGRSLEHHRQCAAVEVPLGADASGPSRSQRRAITGARQCQKRPARFGERRVIVDQPKHANDHAQRFRKEIGARHRATGQLGQRWSHRCHQPRAQLGRSLVEEIVHELLAQPRLEPADSVKLVRHRTSIDVQTASGAVPIAELGEMLDRELDTRLALGAHEAGHAARIRQ